MFAKPCSGRNRKQARCGVNFSSSLTGLREKPTHEISYRLSAPNPSGSPTMELRRTCIPGDRGYRPGAPLEFTACRSFEWALTNNGCEISCIPRTLHQDARARRATTIVPMLACVLATGRTGLGTKPPPQFGQTLASVPSTQSTQNVHSWEQMRASVDAGGRSRSHNSQFGRNSKAMSPLQRSCGKTS